MRRTVTILACCVLSLSASTMAELPEGHPRLFMDPDDVVALRKKVKQPPFSHMLKAIRAKAAAGRDRREMSSILYDMTLRHQAQLYLMTGEKKYARDAAKLTREIISDKKFWNDPHSKGLTRAAGALSVAMAYDFCYEAWDRKLRQDVSRELLEIASGMMASMGRGANTKIANNWQGVRYGASGMAALACDEKDGRNLAADAYRTLLRHLKANLGRQGWNPEGIGYTLYPATFTAPFGVVAKRAGLGDLREDVPAYGRTFWTTLAGTTPIPTSADGRLGIRADLADDHPHYHSNGTLGMAFWYAPDSQLPALKWMYDRFLGAKGDRSWDADNWGGGLYSVLFYPAGIEAKNPAEAIGLNYVDKSHGITIFRNRFKDANDVVALTNAAGRRPAGCHAGPDTNTFRIQGLGAQFTAGSGRTGRTGGQTNLFVGDPPRRGNGEEGTLLDHEFTKRGGGYSVVKGSCMGVTNHVRRFHTSFDPAGGVEAVFVNSDTSRDGTLWRLNTPEYNTIRTFDGGFTITAPTGAVMTCIVLEPAKPTFRTGTFARGGANLYTPLRYRGKGYKLNKWIEFDVDARACVLMVLDWSRANPRVTRSLHGAEATVGKLPIAYEKQSGKVYLGDDAKKLDLKNRDKPLRPRGLKAETLSDRAVKLRWIAEDLGAGKLILQRNVNDKGWADAASLKPSLASYTDRRLPTDANCLYRLVAVNRAGRSDASEPVQTRTWEKGTSIAVEDFAPRTGGKLPDENALGKWRISNGNRGWRYSPRTGSPTKAADPNGMMVTGSVKIRNSNLFYTEDIRGDFSGRDARVTFDYMCRAVTRFGVMLKLGDGRWVVSSRTFSQSRWEWDTLTFRPSAMDKWHVVDPRSRRIGKEIELSADDLADVRGVGVYANWVINQKWARADQLRLIARKLKTRR